MKKLTSLLLILVLIALCAPALATDTNGRGDTVARSAELAAFLDESGLRADVVQMRAVEAPISLLRGEHRWQLFLKMYFKGDADAACAKMQALADAAPAGVRAELEVNPVNMF